MFVLADAVSWVAIGISAASLIAAVFLGLRSTGIARRALRISEAEHQQRQRDRQARAKLDVDVECVNMEQRADGVLLTEGNNANVRLKITVTNSGDREAGRGVVEVDAPLGISDLGFRWSDAGGRELPEYPERAARVGDRNVLSRQFDGVGLGVPQEIYVTMPTSVPSDFPVEVRVRAEHANEPVTVSFPLRIEQKLR